MGFFDLNGELGRQFGSIGVSLDRPVTEINAWRDAEFSAEGPGAERAIKIARKLAQGLGFSGGMRMRLKQAIPEHSGLGSGTQMSLTVGLALNRLYGMGLIIKDVAMLAERGARSGIGLGTFASGGVVIDGGRGSKTVIPPVIARADFPEAWRILLIFDQRHPGLHGPSEIEAFHQLPAFSAQDAAILCRHVLMQALPALAEHDLPAFGLAIRELQERTGDHFAPVQGGRYASPGVAAVMRWLESQAVPCMGQSSWGPTGFAIFADEMQGLEMLQKLQSNFPSNEALSFMLCKGRNQGAIVRDIAPLEQV